MNVIGFSYRCGAIRCRCSATRLCHEAVWQVIGMQPAQIAVSAGKLGPNRRVRRFSAAIAMADEMDSLGVRWRPASPHFFLRTCNEVCDAIGMNDDERNNVVLRKHIARIEDLRLRRAFHAAVIPQQTLNERHPVQYRTTIQHL